MAPLSKQPPLLADDGKANIPRATFSKALSLSYALLPRVRGLRLRWRQKRDKDKNGSQQSDTSVWHAPSLIR